jgi:hypothetical protein
MAKVDVGWSGLALLSRCFVHFPSYLTVLWQYPYQLPHITNPKEHRLIYAVQLPETCTHTGVSSFDQDHVSLTPSHTGQFHISNNFTIKAAPLMDLYDNAEVYGHLAALPLSLSR